MHVKQPENLLLANDKDDIIKIADFGLSKIYTEEMMNTACGTPGYVGTQSVFARWNWCCTIQESDQVLSHGGRSM